MIDRFELVDDVDNNYRSLVILKEPMRLEDIETLVNNVKEKVGYDTYTYDDLFEVLEPLATDIIDLYNTEKIYF